MRVNPVIPVALIASVAAAQHDPGSVLRSMADLFSPAVVRLSAGEEESTRHANAFFIGPGRLIASRAFLHDADAPTVTFDNGTKLPVVSIYDEIIAADIVLAGVDVPPSLRRGLRVSRFDAIAGEQVLLIGAPANPGAELPDHPLADVRVSRHASRVVRVGDDERSIATLELGDFPPELAGSPVLNVSGQVVGVAIPPVPGAEPHAVAASVLLNLDDSANLPLADWKAGASLDDARAAARNAAIPTGPLPRPENYPPPPDKVAGYVVTPSGIEVQPDGSLLLDSRFPLEGKGTKDDPYKLTWDLLISADQTFAPRKGLKTIPERVAMLDGKWVEITGYTAFPLQMQEPNELLVMLNTWDGCCIGVPPTPYDAVEVMLDKPVVGEARFAYYGTIRGVMTVEPYIVGEWLVGLYLIDGATFIPSNMGPP